MKWLNIYYMNFGGKLSQFIDCVFRRYKDDYIISNSFSKKFFIVSIAPYGVIVKNE